jgi:hypothetical protein
MNSTRPGYLNTRQAADFLCKPSRAAVRKFLQRHHIPTVKVGRQTLVLIASLEEAIKRDTKAARTAAAARLQRGKPVSEKDED